MSENLTFVSQLNVSLTNNYVSEPTQALLVQDAECIRQEYLKIIEKFDWNIQMKQKSEILCNELKTSGWSFDIKISEPILIYVDGNLIELNNSINLIGRHPKCDILLKDIIISRLHAVIIMANDPNNIPRIIVIDFWSLYGTTIMSPNNPTKTTNNKKRSLLILDSVPGASIHIDKYKIRFHVRECIICYERPRECRFQCGHSIACSQCATHITRCPLCRSDIRQIGETIGNITL